MRTPGGPPEEDPVEYPVHTPFAAYAAATLIVAAASVAATSPSSASEPVNEGIGSSRVMQSEEIALPAKSPTPAASEPAAEESVSSEPGGRSKQEIRCLARAIYHEARGEPLEGQIAVAEVVIARSQDRRWRGDLCTTIRMPRQFSFVKNGRIPKIRDSKAAQVMMDLARKVVSGRLKSKAQGSLYYHATYVSPSWRHALERTAQIRSHIFYSDPGNT